jgi:IS30 family transposase
VPYYSEELAQIKADKAKRNHGLGEMIGGDHLLADRIAAKIKDGHYSPYAVTAAFEHEGWPTEQRVCAKTIYRYRAKRMFFAVTEADLPEGGSGGANGSVNRPASTAWAHWNGTSTAVPRRLLTGLNRVSGEIDTVKGAQNGPTLCLLTLTDRKTRAEIIRKLPDGTAASVTAALDALERELGTRFPLLFKTITADNGVAFPD